MSEANEKEKGKGEKPRRPLAIHFKALHSLDLKGTIKPDDPEKVGDESTWKRYALTLLPGLNENVDHETWEAVKDGARGYINNGLIDEITRPLATLEAFSPREAIELAKDTSEVPTLERWLKTEKREEVKKVLDEQIKNIKSVTKRANDARNS